MLRDTSHPVASYCLRTSINCSVALAFNSYNIRFFLLYSGHCLFIDLILWFIFTVLGSNKLNYYIVYTLLIKTRINIPEKINVLISDAEQTTIIGFTPFFVWKNKDRAINKYLRRGNGETLFDLVPFHSCGFIGFYSIREELFASSSPRIFWWKSTSLFMKWYIYIKWEIC